MNISINKKYFEKLVNKMEMDYIKNSDAFKSYWSGIKEERDIYNKNTSLEYLKENRGLIDFEPLLKNKSSYKDIANDILIRSLYYCPIDTGELKKSSYIENSEDGIKIGYNISYATYVHEILDNNHIAPTRSKFLEDAVIDIWNYSNEFWTKKKIPVTIYISYDPLYIFITDLPSSNESVGLLVSNYNMDYESYSNEDEYIYEDDDSDL